MAVTIFWIYALSTICVSLGVVSSSSFGDVVRDVDPSEYFINELYGELAAELALEKQSSDGADEGWYSAPADIDDPASYSQDSPALHDSPKWVNLRRPEEEDQVLPSGYQFVSGGAGEGKQQLKPEGSVNNKQEVKTDAELPSYCSPPNPCPKGKTAANGCQEGIPDTAEFNRNYIRRQMQAGYCGCDFEHMSQDVCPQEAGDLDEYGISDVDDLLDEILEGQLGDQLDDRQNPFVSDGEKRKSLTAKKGGQHVLIKRSIHENSSPRLYNNPFLKGARLPVIAKKSPHMD